jgi:nitroreductase
MVLIFSETKAPYAIQSVWLAIGHILLALEESGLGTITYTPSITREVTEEIDLPKGFRLEAILPVGISVDEKPKEPKLGLNQVSYLNSWGHSLNAVALLSGTVSR